MPGSFQSCGDLYSTSSLALVIDHPFYGFAFPLFLIGMRTFSYIYCPFRTINLLGNGCLNHFSTFQLSHLYFPYEESLWYSGYESLSVTWIANIFSQSVACFCTPLEEQPSFEYSSNYLSFPVWPALFVSYLKTLSLPSRSWKYFPLLPSERFIVLPFPFRSTIHLHLILV